MNGSQQICFTDCAGKALFSIHDTHAEIDGVNYSMPDFAKRMKHNQISFAPA